MKRNSKLFGIFSILLVINLNSCQKKEAVMQNSHENSPFRSLKSHYNGSPEKWRQFLECWWGRKRSKTSPDIATKFDSYWKAVKIDVDSNEPKIRSKLTDLEKKIGQPLPPSYRDFILATGGRFLFPYHALQFDPKVGKDDFYDPNKVDLLSKLEPESWRISRSVTEGLLFTQAEYYRYGVDADGVPLGYDGRYYSEHVDHLILVGSAYVYGTFELNPLEVTSDGEWEAWNFYENLSGVARYRSFAEMMQDMYFNEMNESREFRGRRIREDSCALILFDGPLPSFAGKDGK